MITQRLQYNFTSITIKFETFSINTGNLIRINDHADRGVELIATAIS